MEIKDMTNTNMLNLRRTIFLTIMSSVNFEECAALTRSAVHDIDSKPVGNLIGGRGIL